MSTNKEKGMISDCHGAKVKWDVDTYNTYTQTDGDMKTFICSKCLKPCKLISEADIGDATENSRRVGANRSLSASVPHKPKKEGRDED